MKYYEFTFSTNPRSEAIEDVLADVLAGAGFESFVRTGELDLRSVPGSDNPEAPEFAAAAEEEQQFKAYIQVKEYDAETLREAVENFPLPGVSISYEKREAEDKDWNEVWEQNYFQPLVVGTRCVVAGTFHKDVPEADYRITINPQMSFGTGHHATTYQMLERLLDEPLAGKRVLDMGCGTGILAILARMRGASECVAIDVDEWCVKNTEENIALNSVDNIRVVLGDASALAAEKPFDVIIANINRNILLQDLPRYAERLAPGGIVLMSGFYEKDVPLLREAAERLGLAFEDGRERDGWACIKCRRQA